MFRIRKKAAKAFFAAVVLAQAYFVVAAYGDPHKFFGYQPFSESSTWEAQIVSVRADGERVDIRHGWEGYHWHQLVRDRGLNAPFEMHRAHSGVDSTLTFFQAALDWVATHTPRDTRTQYLEARVRYIQNRRAPVELTLRSVDRPQAHEEER